MFFQEPLLDLLFLVFFQHDAQKGDFGTPCKIHRGQNGAPNPTFSQKCEGRFAAKGLPGRPQDASRTPLRFSIDFGTIVDEFWHRI